MSLPVVDTRNRPLHDLRICITDRCTFRCPYCMPRPLLGNDVGFPVERVLDGIEAAREAGLWPIKINMVVKRGVNDDSVVAMARHFHGTGYILRFIEYMDVGNTNGWRMDDVVPAAEIVRRIDAALPLDRKSV